MSWWGKVVGGAFGFLIGGPLGALLGASLGHQLDSGFGQQRIEGFQPGDQERIQAAFFTATFSVMGCVSKADGRVSEDEISLAKQIMAEMQLDPLQQKAAISLFARGKESDFDLDQVLDQFRRECHRRLTLLQMFLEIQVHAALADGRLDSSENHILRHIAENLGFSESDLQRIIAMAKGAQAQGAGGRPQSTPVSDPYKVLGVTAQTPLAEIKKTYRRLLSQHHPDKLVSKGLPEEMIKLANKKTHEIQQAWKEIQAQHSAS